MDSPSVTRTPSSEFCHRIAESGRVTMLRCPALENPTGDVVTGQIAVVRGDKGTTGMDGFADGGELPGRAHRPTMAVRSAWRDG